MVSLLLLSWCLQGQLALKVWDPRLVMSSGFLLNSRDLVTHVPVAFHPSTAAWKLGAIQEMVELAPKLPNQQPFNGSWAVDFDGPYAERE